jgi:hypothetical protein
MSGLLKGNMMHISRLSRLCLAAVALTGSAAVGAVATGAADSTSAGAASSSTPACTFGGSASPILSGATPGEKVAIACTGLKPLHPYLVFETSLLLAIDPAAKPLLTGKVTSVPGLISLLDSLPEINTKALSFPVSNLSGGLTMNYKLPTSHAPDPNAVCPPTTAQMDTGLIGCGLTMIDLTSFLPVPAGSILVSYAGDSLFPPAPTIALSTATATPGETVAVGDAPGATTYFWVATLASLDALLSGGTPTPPVATVTLTHGKTSVVAANDLTVTSAVYNRPVLTPPKISGGFTVPAGLKGLQDVTVEYQDTILGLPLANFAYSELDVK